MTEPTTTPDEPFDPALPERIGAFLKAWNLVAHVTTRDCEIVAVRHGATVYALTEQDLTQLLERDAFARKENKLLAEKCARYRGELDDARIIARTLATTLRAGDFSDADIRSALSHFGGIDGKLPGWLTTAPAADTENEA